MQALIPTLKIHKRITYTENECAPLGTRHHHTAANATNYITPKSRHRDNRFNIFLQLKQDDYSNRSNPY